LELFAADRTGKPDYALYTGGGRIIHELTSRTYLQPATLMGQFIQQTMNGIKSLFQKPVPIGEEEKKDVEQREEEEEEEKTERENEFSTREEIDGRVSPISAISPSSNRGQCWPMKGDSGKIGIKLSEVIIPTSFSIEHIPKSIATSMNSAPKMIEVYALNSTDYSISQKVASYIYKINGPSVQTFEIHEPVFPCDTIQFKILENYGNPFYTCIYRLRVHGNPPTESS